MPKLLKYALLVSVIASFTIFTVIFFQDNQEDYTNINEHQDELDYYQNPSNYFEGADEEADENYEGLSHVDDSFLHEIYEKNRDPIYIGQLFVNVIQSHDIDLFSQLFHPQVFNDFIGTIEADKRVETIENIMMELSNNQTISRYHIEQKKGTHGEEYSEIDIMIIYEDETTIALEEIILALESHHHGDGAHGIYSINLSPSELLDNIE
jgi:hypothetical protein